MNKIILGKLVFVLMILFILFSVNVKVVKANTPEKIISGADNFIKTGQNSDKIEIDALKNLSDMVYDILLALGTVIAVIVGVVLGIQFMTGSIEQKVKVKESLMTYVVGCVVIFGAFGIWKLVVTILGTL